MRQHGIKATKINCFRVIIWSEKLSLDGEKYSVCNLFNIFVNSHYNYNNVKLHVLECTANTKRCQILSHNAALYIFGFYAVFPWSWWASPSPRYSFPVPSCPVASVLGRAVTDLDSLLPLIQPSFISALHTV